MSSSPSIEQITTLYRQNAIKFLIKSDKTLRSQIITSNDYTSLQHTKITTASWIDCAARSLALRSVDAPLLDVEDHDTDRKINKNYLNKTNKSNEESGVAYYDRTLPWSDCICMACGTLLMPPSENSLHSSLKEFGKDSLFSWNCQISLRPLKRGRTRRRRASRVKAKELRNRSLSLQRRGISGGGTNNSTSLQIRKECIQKEKIQQMASAHNLGDGRAKNCLVIKCNHCGRKKKRKGIEIMKKPTSVPVPVQSPALSPSQGVIHSKKSSSRKNSQCTAASKRKRMDAPTPITHDSTDFISVPSIDSSFSVKRMPWQTKVGDIDETKGINISPLLQGGKKRKKKNRNSDTATKKSDLMEFLSSLND